MCLSFFLVLPVDGESTQSRMLLLTSAGSPGSLNLGLELIPCSRSGTPAGLGFQNLMSLLPFKFSYACESHLPRLFVAAGAKASQAPKLISESIGN